MPARLKQLLRAKRNVVFLIYTHCFVTLTTEVRKLPPKTGRRKSPISEKWPSFGRLDSRLAKTLPKAFYLYSHAMALHGSVIFFGALWLFLSAEI